MGETIKLKTKDGATIGAYKASPAGTPKGGMVVLQEIFGVNHHMRAVADFYASQGYLAVAPALFDRVEPDVELGYTDDFPKALALRAKTKMDETLADIAAAIDVVSGAGKVGVVGYCWGGTLAYAAAAHLKVDAAVGYYGGGIAAMENDMPKVPIELHFGDRDKSISMADVDKIRARHPHMAIFVYPADHGFNCDERGSHDAPSSALAQRRTLDFFARHI